MHLKITKASSVGLTDADRKKRINAWVKSLPISPKVESSQTGQYSSEAKTVCTV